MSLLVRHRRRVAEAALLGCTILWGTTFSVTKPLVHPSPESGMVPMGPFVLSSLRMLIGAGVLLAYLIAFRYHPREHTPLLARFRAAGVRSTLRARIRARARHYWVPSLVLGGLTYVGFCSQTVGMRFTSASKSSLITGLFVVFVPMVTAVLLRRVPARRIWFAVAVSFAGTALLTLFASGGEGIDWSAFGLGEWLTLVCAITFSMQIIATEFFVIRYDAVLLSIGTLLASGLASAATAIGSGEVWTLAAPQWAGAIYLGLTGTGVCFVLATWGQRHVASSRAAIIFGMEPLFGTCFAVLLLGDTFTPMMLVGAAMILWATFLTRPLPGEVSPLEEFLEKHGAPEGGDVAPAAAPHLAAN
jgi:drug/metabolite transporter (DMT)-like permease